MARVFNARRPERFPAGVLLAGTSDDVVEGVRLARERGLRVSVRAGGHSWAVWSLHDDALLIDLGGMREMTFDPASGVATASPGLIVTPQISEFLDEPGHPVHEMLRTHPLGRLGVPEDVARVALFLASDEAGYLNAVDIVVDGGQSVIS